MKNNELNVHGKNELKRIAFTEITNILPQLIQYLNKRIDTQTGLSKKFVVNLSNPEPKPIKDGFANLTLCYLTVLYNELILKMSICLNGGSYADRTYYCQYFDYTYVLGKMEIFNLVEILTLEEIVKNYGLNNFINLEEEEKKITRYQELKKEMDNLKYSIKIDF